MSGGHWDYGQRFIDAGETLEGVFDFLAAAEHELDWGICCDTCLDCAKQRVAAGLIRFFDGDVEAAIAVLRDSKQNVCLDERCKPPVQARG